MWDVVRRTGIEPVSPALDRQGSLNLGFFLNVHATLAPHRERAILSRTAGAPGPSGSLTTPSALALRASALNSSLRLALCLEDRAP